MCGVVDGKICFCNFFVKGSHSGHTCTAPFPSSLCLPSVLYAQSLLNLQHAQSLLQLHFSRILTLIQIYSLINIQHHTLKPSLGHIIYMANINNTLSFFPTTSGSNPLMVTDHNCPTDIFTGKHYTTTAPHSHPPCHWKTPFPTIPSSPISDSTPSTSGSSATSFSSYSTPSYFTTRSS